MRTKCGLWWTCPMIDKPQKINGSSRGRQTLIVVLLSTKLVLSQKGFRQVQGVDYVKTFSLVVMLKSVRIMLAIATFYDYETKLRLKLPQLRQLSQRRCQTSGHHTIQTTFPICITRCLDKIQKSRIINPGSIYSTRKVGGLGPRNLITCHDKSGRTSCSISCTTSRKLRKCG